MQINKLLLQWNETAGLLSMASMALFSLAVAAPAALVKVAVYKGGTGGKAVHQALSADAHCQATLINTITADELMKYDVLVTGSYMIAQPPQINAIKIFVACGGGLVLHHTACGRQLPRTLFPEIAVKVLDRRPDTILVVKDSRHSLAGGLPSQFEHAYNDHLFLEPGAAGAVVLTDREGSAVVVSGAAGAGRVVFNGALPGYWYDPVDFTQGEKLPAGPELQLVLNTVVWAGEHAITALPAGELAARRKKAEEDIRIEDLSRFLPTSDWFGTEMLRGSYLAMPPVQTLGGRYFITYDATTWRNHGKIGALAKDPAWRAFFMNRLRLDILQFKWLGITDIIYWSDMIGERVFHKTEVPDSVEQYHGIDELEALIRMATPEGLNVWVSWHSSAKSKEFAEKYCAKDGEGKFYLYGDEFVEDLLSPVYLERCRQMIDEYHKKYKPMGNFKGILTYDEIWFTYVDFNGDDLAAIAKFCQERFGEKLPADFPARLAKQTRWNDPSDPWRRRYILFKQHVMTSFTKELVDYCHKRGLQIGICTSYHPGRWFFGMDNVALAQLGADYLIGNYTKTAKSSYPNTLRWSHHNDPWGLYNTSNFRGGPGGLKFTFCDLWRVVMYGSDPAHTREFARNIYDLRLFADSASMERVALLMDEQALEMLAPEAKLPFNRAHALLDAVQRVQPATFIFSRDGARFSQYRVLVATPYAVRGLPEESLGQLRKYVEGGGIVLSINADWSVARADMENEKDRTAEMLGVTYGSSAPPAEVSFKWQDRDIPLNPGTPRRVATAAEGTKVLASFAEGQPAITEKTIGKGKVIAMHFDAGAELAKNANPALEGMLNGLLRDLAAPPVVMEGKGASVISELKKGNWIAVALYPDRTPAEVTLKVDVRALGIPGNEFRMIMLGKQMEISRPGDLFGSAGFWTADDLKKGFRVTIADDQRVNLPLPERIDISDFSNVKDGEYCDRVLRDRWDKEGKLKRNYSHEIVVIAPADEPVMPGVKPTIK